MTRKEIEKKRRAELRKEAEKRIKTKRRVAKKLRQQDVLELIHELEVHQVELELQNEELRTSQAEIEESRRKYFDLYDLAPVGYVTLNRNRIIQEINLAGAALLGRERRRLKGVAFSRFLSATSAHAFEQFWRRLLQTEYRHEVEVTIGRDKEVSLVVLLAGVATPEKSSVNNFVQITMTDLTARRSAESWVRKLIETTQDAVVSVDGQARITLFNPAAEKIFGYAAAEVLGKKVNMLMAKPYTGAREGNIKRWYEPCDNELAIAKVRELSAQRKNGDIFPIELSVTEVDDNSGVRYVAYIRDVSERARLQAQLMEKARLGIIDDTTAMVAHEIANPLHGMYMSLQLMERSLTGIADQSMITSLRRINAEVSRLKRLLADFRTLSMHETYNLRPTALARLVEELCAGEMANLDSMGIRVVLELKPGLPDILVDPSKIKQVLLNLFKNAEEAMPQGGTLTVQAYETEGEVMVEVCDNGVGLPADFQLESPFKTTKPAGTGLAARGESRACFSRSRR
jgi:PAS domain S-box-containing protein